MALNANHVAGDPGHAADHNLLDTAVAAKLDSTTAASTYAPKPSKGLFANRPAAGTSGRRYYATDQDKEYLDDGTTWHEIVTRSAADAAYRAKANVGCRVTSSVSQNLTTATDTALKYEVEGFDTSAFHDTATNNTRLTVPAGLAGTYMVSGQVSFAVNTTGDRMLTIKKNGNNDAITSAKSASGLNHRQQVSTIIQLSVGDYVELFAYQTSGGTLGTVANANEGWFGLTYLGS